MMRIFWVAVFLVGTSLGPPDLFAQAGDGSLAFTNVTVVDVRDGSLHADRTVLVVSNRIASMGDTGEVEVPAGATRIDGTGRFLIPGLWDMHVHTLSDRITREILFPLFVAHGVTGVRSMAADCFVGDPTCIEEGGSDPYLNINDVKAWRREMAAGELVGSRIVAASYYVNSPGPDEPSTPQYPRTAEHGRDHARLLHERGVGFIKIYDMVSREAYFALAEEANRLGLPFAGHVPVAVRASEASDAGQVSIEHLGETHNLQECSSRSARVFVAGGRAPRADDRRVQQSD